MDEVIICYLFSDRLYMFSNSKHSLILTMYRKILKLRLHLQFDTLLMLDDFVCVACENL